MTETTPITTPTSRSDGKGERSTLIRIAASLTPRDEATAPDARPTMDRARAIAVWGWRFFAAFALLSAVSSVDRLIGPASEPAFFKFHAADFGGFYTGATIAHEGNYENLGNIDTQKETQARIQRSEETGWRWFNPLPHPPILSFFTSPLAQLPIRTAYWVWVIGSLAAAALAAYLLGRALTPAVPIATTIIMVTFEPLWHLVWWGQVDAFVLLPFAAGCALLVRSRSRGDDFAAGALMGSMAIIPQYAIVPFLALAWGRRWAAAGMAAVGGALAFASVLLVGRTGLDHYRDMVEYFGAFRGTDTVTEWAMFNVRGVLLRQFPELSHTTAERLVWVVSLGLAALAVVAAGRALPKRRAPDLALGLVALAALVTSYHTHRQTMVFLFVLFAAFIGRSLKPGVAPWMIPVWAAPVIFFHVGADYLRDAPYRYIFYPIQRYLTPPAIGLLVVLALVLLIPPLARRLWLRSGSNVTAPVGPYAKRGCRRPGEASRRPDEYSPFRAPSRW
ncbi:MAG TPA: glycosyltransferase family 87 protein [Thermomicrobiales bacterium]|nr:glycosyltransferase family 87 protein [Thermomicrobiales bacterium]